MAKDVTTFFKGIIEKWLGTIILGGLILISTAAWDYWNRFYEVPDRMDAWEARAKRDSLHYSKIIKENARLDSMQDADLFDIMDSISAINKRMFIYHH